MWIALSLCCIKIRLAAFPNKKYHIYKITGIVLYVAQNFSLHDDHITICMIVGTCHTYEYLIMLTKSTLLIIFDQEVL